MAKPQTEFEKQVIQIAALGVWQIVTGKPLKKPLTPVPDARWHLNSGLFVTLKKSAKVRGSMGLLESGTTLQETLFNAGQTAATHDKRFPPVSPDEINDLNIEVTLLTDFQKMNAIEDLHVGHMGVVVSRGEKQGVLLPQVAVENGWDAEQFLEACCEKAQLSHKAWKDPNTLVELFCSLPLEGGSLVNSIEGLV